MIIDINEQFKVAGIWLSREENNDQETKQKILPLLLEYKKKKYTPVFYISGEKDFIEETVCLLKHNINL